MQVSKFRVFSLGIVASNKKLDSNSIEFLSTETDAMTSGEVTDNVETYKAKAEDADGAAYHVEVETTSTRKADWIPLGCSNRMTAPDVRRGEQVVIYTFADTNKYYWCTMQQDMKFRKLETVIYGFSATKDENAKPGPDNMYFFEVSTHKKLIHLHTSTSNGEPFAYDIQINAEEGFIQIQDDQGNLFNLNSTEHRLLLKNADGSLLDMTRTNIQIKATDSIAMEANSISQKSNTHSLNASTYGITAKTTQTGPVLLKGDMKSAPGGGGSGSIELGGNINVVGSMTADTIHSRNPIDAPGFG